MNTAANGSASRGARTKVIFEINAPVAITLEREPPSFSTPGNWGEQYMYSLEGHQIAFLEPEVHEEICNLGARPGDTFTITKTKDGRKNVWVVMRGDVAQQAAKAIQAPAPAPPAPRRGTPAATPAIAARIEAAKEENAARAELPAPRHVSGNIMQAALCAALEATHAAEAFAEGIGANYRASSEDIRALAITIYIEITGSSHGGRKR
jgi:hypothetical protein